jgi:GNAT superfamily N-acetyltransferase
LVVPKIEVELKKLQVHELDMIHNVKKLNTRNLKDRLYRGDDCYACLIKGDVISYHWVQYNGNHLLQQSGEVYNLNDEACIYHVRVKKEFQKNGISKFVYSKIIDDNLKDGIKNIWIYTNYKNVPNQKSLERLGFSKSEIIYSLKFGSKFYKLFSTKIK